MGDPEMNPEQVGQDRAVETTALHLPSLTTTVVGLTFFAMIFPELFFTSSMLINLAGVSSLVVLGAGLRLFFVAPSWALSRRDTVRLDRSTSWYPIVADKILHWSGVLGVAPPLVLGSHTLSSQLIGTVKKVYFILNANVVKAVVTVPDTVASSKRDTPLDAIIVHELAHIRNGDHWKTQISVFIAGAYVLAFLVNLLVMPLISNNFRLLAPLEYLEIALEAVVRVVRISVILYLLVIMIRCREFYADGWARQLVGLEALGQARWYESSVGLSRKGSGFLGALAGNAVWTRRANVEREKEIHPSFRSINRQILFAGGLVVAGSIAQRGGLASLAAMLIISIVIGSWLTIVYTLPYVITHPASSTTQIRQPMVAIGMFLLGQYVYIAVVAIVFEKGMVAWLVSRNVADLTKLFQETLGMAIVYFGMALLIALGVILGSFLVHKYIRSSAYGGVSLTLTIFVWLSTSTAVTSVMLSILGITFFDITAQFGDLIPILFWLVVMAVGGLGLLALQTRVDTT